VDDKSKNESLLKNSIDRAMAVKLYRMQCDREWVPTGRFATVVTLECACRRLMLQEKESSLSRGHFVIFRQRVRSDGEGRIETFPAN